jgi:Na+/proline symporter
LPKDTLPRFAPKKRKIPENTAVSLLLVIASLTAQTCGGHFFNPAVVCSDKSKSATYAGIVFCLVILWLKAADDNN